MQLAVSFVIFLTFCIQMNSVDAQCPINCSCPRGFKLSIYCLPGQSIIPQNIPNNIFALSLSGTYSRHNNLGRLSRSSFSKFTDLQRLHLSFSEIKEIEDGTFSRLKNLKQLNLANNRIRNITARTFEGLGNLEVLHLTGNEYCKIDQNAFSNLRSLKELHMGQIRIMSVYPSTFDGLSRITILDLHGNNLQKFDQEIFKKLPHLQYLDLSGNLIRTLSNSSELNFSKLKTVHLFDNPWQCNCELEWMRRLHNAFHSDDPIICAGPKNLMYMSFTDLRSTDFHCIEPNIIKCDQPSYDVAFHGQLNVNCKIEGDPYPEISWVRPDGQKLNGGSVHNGNYRVFENGTIWIVKSTAIDDGTWTIEISSSQGHKEKNLKFHVEIPTTRGVIPTSTTMPSVQTTLGTNISTPIDPPVTRRKPTVTLSKTKSTIQTTKSNNTPQLSDAIPDESSIKIGVIVVGVGGGVSLLAIFALSAYIVKNKLAAKNRVGDRKRLKDGFDSVRTPRSSRGLSPVSYAWA